MPRFLCLPGYLQSGKVFAEKSSGIRKILTKKLGYELDYIDPPRVIQSKEDLPFVLGANEKEASDKWDNLVDQNLNRCWWEHSDEGVYHGFDDLVKYVVDLLKTKGPYEGIIGFSQGAAMAAIVANLASLRSFELEHFKVAVLFSGFAFTVPLDEEQTLSELASTISNLKEYQAKVKINPLYQEYYTVPRDLPTRIISVYGTEDGVVPPIRTKHLNLLFPMPTEFNHDGGHYLPNKKQFLEPIVESIKEAVDKRASL